MFTDAFDAERLRAVRAEQPSLIGELLRGRTRREILRDSRRLFIVAADHPARGALAAGGRETAMADRYDLLSRLVIALQCPGVDGVLGTPDIIEDLAILGVLDDKVVVGSMNRGGLRGARFEMDDRFTGYDVPTMLRDGIDFAKLLIRINLADPGTANTLEASARAVTAASEARLPIMLEPFVSEWRDNAVHNDLTTEAVIKSVAIASGLGASSAYSWLKLPVVPNMEQVMAATTLPTLLLGGDPASEQVELFETWSAALALPGVRGIVAGRTLLYPDDDDVASAVDTVASLVHSTSRVA
ncbi:deoxyribose-phosphate aldolase [Leifsonia sp. TF02-11]|uniref:Cgl0159 family (beta/alpha)8-fold protein n=1 Tax=Leifsonia sp. TF02-11 TaxID=2815212 RepID=UPI001AA17A4B|nr:deoxyribose-phosphate aldolase [Leifsonia sp. TF02-11]MBO1740760.1 deoxyribose-phosphate aldolase [Leifsonia sp. TF02-11]